MRNKWKSKVEALIRLAEDQQGKPEGDLAKEKLASVLAKHPEAASYVPLQNFWKMVRDYQRRMVATAFEVDPNILGS